MNEYCLVTGANGGIGKEITRMLLERGERVIMACRNPKKAQPVLECMKAAFPAADVQLMLLDLGSLVSIKAFAEAFATKGIKLKALINNAGVMSKDYSLTPDGFETTVGTNYVGVYAFTRLMIPFLASGACVLNTVSVTTKLGKVSEDFLTRGSEGYIRLVRYSDSKLGLLLFTVKLEQQLRDKGIRVCGIDPGVVNTGIISMQRWFDPLTDLIFRPFIKKPETAALVTFRALDSGMTGRVFRGKKNFAFQKYAVQHKLLDKLWENTENILAQKGITL